MTERLYYTSDATECPARVVNCLGEADGRYAIELDRTLFHPQGGGQPADRGWIGELAVESVAARGESIVHIVAQPLPSGEVAIRVDAAGRRAHHLGRRDERVTARSQRPAGADRRMAGGGFTASDLFCRRSAQGRVRRYAELSLRRHARGQPVRTGRGRHYTGEDEKRPDDC